MWTNGLANTHFYPLKSKAFASTTVSDLVYDLNGIPREVVTDGAGEETGGSWDKEMRHFRIKHLMTEPYSKWQNLAKADYRELLRSIR